MHQKQQPFLMSSERSLGSELLSFNEERPHKTLAGLPPVVFRENLSVKLYFRNVR